MKRFSASSHPTKSLSNMNSRQTSPKLVIIGAGCTGLGAAYRLHELGHDNFLVLEKNEYPGGLAASFLDSQGFTWDIGGHVQFSHYDYFDRLMDRALGGAWLEHMRQSFIWIRNRFIPYPLQNNIQQLPGGDVVECLRGLVAVRAAASGQPANFEEWIVKSFGRGLADLFLLPYNAKVWAFPPTTMGYNWVGERVAEVDLGRIVENVVVGRDDPGWGPNSTFRFPLRGGTGAIWNAVAALLPPKRLRYQVEVTRIDSVRRVAIAADGEEFPYDRLISTLPLNVLAAAIGDERLISETGHLRHSGTHVVGIGLRGEIPKTVSDKSWMYFPDGDCPFYRVTVFSNYSPRNVPGPGYWSLMAEVATSPWRPIDEFDVVDQVVHGMRNTHLLDSSSDIVSTWRFYAPFGYPTPTLDRDEHVNSALHGLEALGILSRGRFGAWKYEVANQDHACMQGVEAADRILFGAPELTCWHSELVNAGRHRSQRVIATRVSNDSGANRREVAPQLVGSRQ